LKREAQFQPIHKNGKDVVAVRVRGAQLTQMEIPVEVVEGISFPIVDEDYAGFFIDKRFPAATERLDLLVTDSRALASSLSKRDEDSSFDGDFPPLQRGRTNEPDAAYKWMKSQGLGSKKQRQRAVKRQQREIDAPESAMFVEDITEKWEAAASAGKPAQRQSQEEQALHDAQRNHEALRAHADALSRKLKSNLPAAHSRQQTYDDVLTPAEAHEHKKRLKECREAVEARRQADQAEKEAYQAQLVHLRECREDVIAKRARNPDWDPEFDDHDSDVIVSDNEGEDYDLTPHRSNSLQLVRAANGASTSRRWRLTMLFLGLGPHAKKHQTDNAT
jgi:hypothetical protein